MHHPLPYQNNPINYKEYLNKRLSFSTDSINESITEEKPNDDALFQTDEEYSPKNTMKAYKLFDQEKSTGKL